MSKPRVVIVGAGFAGVRVARDLAGRSRGAVEIVLINESSMHGFTPAYYEIATAYSGDDEFHHTLRRVGGVSLLDIIRGTHIEFIKDRVQNINLDERSVTLANGQIVQGDVLVLALGSQMCDYDVHGVREHAMGFKSLDNALAVHQRIQDLIHQFLVAGTHRPVRIGICGAGFTGVELAAELGTLNASLMRTLHLAQAPLEIHLIDRSRILTFIQVPRERAYAYRRLTDLSVVLHEQTPIQIVEADRIVATDGRSIETDLTIWTAGIEGPELTSGYLKPNAYLQLPDHPHVFVAGDLAQVVDPRSGTPVPAQAYNAIDEGKVVAENIWRILNQQPLRSFRPESGIWIVPLGGQRALAHLWGKATLTGWAAWVLMRLIDLSYLVSIMAWRRAWEFFWNGIQIFVENDYQPVKEKSSRQSPTGKQGRGA